MSTDDKDRVKAEVESRLEDFFSEEGLGGTAETGGKAAAPDDGLGDLLSDDAWDFDDPAPEAPVLDADEEDLEDFVGEDSWAMEEEKTSAEELGLQDLQVSILSLDWEITDEVVEKLVSESIRLKSVRSNDPVSVTFLSLLESLARYILARKAGAHPASVSLLRTVYDDLEKVLSMPGMDDESKRQIALADVTRFVRLQSKVGAKDGKKSVKPIREADIVEEIPIRPAEVVEEIPVGAAPAPAMANIERLVQELLSLKEQLARELEALPKKVGEAVEKALAERG
ncbi:MAG: hypothetical protein JRI97_11615 [Deltaproteobacteria bacterium]|nr:hypothetical protein [Deltaproteobacteria bacterium]